MGSESFVYIFLKIDACIRGDTASRLEKEKVSFAKTSRTSDTRVIIITHRDEGPGVISRSATFHCARRKRTRAEKTSEAILDQNKKN